MSALGQKQTFAVQNGMSALPPKADIGLRRELLGERGSDGRVSEAPSDDAAAGVVPAVAAAGTSFAPMNFRFRG